MFNRYEMHYRITAVLKEARINCGVSRKDMAKAMHKSEKTIESWDTGMSYPNLVLFLEWFKVLGLNPLPYTLQIIFGDIYSMDTDFEDDKRNEEKLIHFIKHVATPREKKLLAYNLLGNTGSSVHAQLEWVTAHNQLGMRDRVNEAAMTLSSYRMSKAAGVLRNPRSVQPNEEFLEWAVESGRRAVYKGDSGYSI